MVLATCFYQFFELLFKLKILENIMFAYLYAYITPRSILQNICNSKMIKRERVYIFNDIQLLKQMISAPVVNYVFSQLFTCRYGVRTDR